MHRTSVIQSALDYIEDNLRSDLDAQEIAQRAGFSRFHFGRMFRQVTGMPLMQYVRRRRLLHAVHAQRCGLSATKSALAYGYDTYAGFYRAFRREFGCTPAQYLAVCRASLPARIDLAKEETLMVSRTQAAEVLRHWNLQDLPLAEVFYESTGEHNDRAYYVGSKYVLKFSADLAKLTTHIELSRALESQGLPAATPVPTANGETYSALFGGCFFLARRVPGSPLRSSDFYTGDTAGKSRFLGSIIGRMHAALAAFDYPAPERDLLASSLDALPRVRNVLPLPADFADTFARRFAELYPLLPRQLIHRDPNPSNILVSQDAWGFIDFELSERSVRLFDPCYAATAILSETFDRCDEAVPETWLTILHNLLIGYDDAAHLTAAERAAVPYVTLANQLLCVAWYADQPQYAAQLAANRRMTAWLLDNFDRLKPEF